MGGGVDGKGVLPVFGVIYPMCTPLSYDASGNLTQGYTPEGYPFIAAYDADNRLTSLSFTNGNGALNQTQFTYLGNFLLKKQQYQDGDLVKETRNVYDGFRLMQERDHRNNVVREYTYGLGLPGGIGGLLRLNKSGTPYSYLFDGKSNVTALLDSLGQVAETYQYDPFVAPLGAAHSINQPMQFSTKPYDEQTGLSYYGYRFYVPALGRWLTRDRIREMGGTNLYGFVGNNPVNFVDPNGNGPWAVAACVGMSLGATASTINDLENLYNEIKELKKQREGLSRKCD